MSATIEVATGRLRDSLRRATAPQHERLERNPRLAQLAAGALDLADYRDLLLAKLGFYRPVERALAGAVDWPALGVPLPGHTARLIADLADQGCTDADLAEFPDCPAVPTIATLWQAIGCRYVLEGASLGGQLIARALRGKNPPWPLRFYAGADDDDDVEAPVWRRYCALLNRLTPAERQEQDAIEAACATFQRLDDHLQSGRVAPGGQRPTGHATAACPS
jgi:heme oxygenase